MLGSIVIVIQTLIEHFGNPDQTQRSATSGLRLHNLPASHKKDVRLIGVKSREIRKPGTVVFVASCHCINFKDLHI